MRIERISWSLSAAQILLLSCAPHSELPVDAKSKPDLVALANAQRFERFPGAPRTEFPEGGEATEYDRVHGDSGTKRPVGLCELVHWYPQAIGLYHVERLTGYSEPEPDAPANSVGAHTYAMLTQIEAWGPGPSVQVVRLNGGPLPGNRRSTWDVDLKVGEDALLFFDAPRTENRGYYGLDSLGVFHRKPDGSLSNGQLFTSTAVSDRLLKMAIADALFADKSGTRCPQDMLPDYGNRSAKYIEQSDVAPTPVEPLEEGGDEL